MAFELLVFDLDGTLIDSELDLALSVNATRANVGLEPLEHSRIASYVGNGAEMLIRRSLGPDADEKLVDECLRFFYFYYHDHMLDNTRLYPGVAEALEAWVEQGKKMAVLTNKPVKFSRTIVERLGLNETFFQVYGGNSFETKKPDPEGIERLIEEARSTAAATVMIGDSSVDVLTARNAGTLAAGVSYGLRPESFEEHPPDILVDSMTELVGALAEGALQPQI